MQLKYGSHISTFPNQISPKVKLVFTQRGSANQDSNNISEKHSLQLLPYVLKIDMESILHFDEE